MPTDDVTVTYLPVDGLPGGVPAVFAVSPDGRHLDVLMSRAATVDELAVAFGPMYRAMQRTAMGLHAVA